MTKTALLLPGQAELEGGKVLEIIEAIPNSETFLRVVEQTVGLDIREIVGDNKTLNQVRNSQLTQFVCSALLAESIFGRPYQFVPNFLIGHSMGEYTALYLSGALDLETTIRLLAKRAELITSVPDGSMALLKSDPGPVEKILRNFPQVTIAAINIPGYVTITGPLSQVEDAGGTFEETGIIYKLLDSIKAISHSPLLADQAKLLGKLLADTSINSLGLSVVATNRGELLRRHKRREIETYLQEQLTTPVRWLDSVRFLWGRGVRCFVECGASPFLGGLVRKIYPKAQIIVISGPSDLEKVSQINLKLS